MFLARLRNPLAILYLVLATAILGFAYRYHVAQREAVAREARNQLVSLADIKVNYIASWRMDKINDGRTLAANRLMLAGLERLVGGRSSVDEQAALGQWIDAYCQELNCAGATVTDPQGRVVLSHGRRYGDENHFRELTRQAMADGVVQMRDLHPDSGAPAHLGLLVPLRLDTRAAPFGVLLTSLDPNDYLYPLLQRWPVPSTTGESALFRIENGQAVFLSPLRKRGSTVDWLRVSANDRRLVAARAANGERGTMEGLDYSGARVFAAVQEVPGTQWLLVAKMDADEVLPPLSWKDAPTAALAFSLLLAGAAGMYVLWRRQEVRIYRARYETEHARLEEAKRYEAERRAMTEELQRSMRLLGASESRFRNAFEQAAVGMVHAGTDGRFLRVNQRFCEVIGYTRDELLTMNYTDVTHPDERERDRERVQAIVSGAQGIGRWTKRYIRKDGTAIWAAITVSALRSPGEPPQLLAVIEDITELVRNQEELQQSEERFRQLVERAPEGILVITGLKIQYANPEAVRIFGASSAAELVGTSILDRAHPEERESARERSREVLAGGAMPRTERRLMTLDGKEIPGEVHLARINYGGQPAVLAFYRDLTESKRAEEERARLEQGLRQAQKMESVGRLAGGVAHDFNNHLTVINGYCGMLLDRLGPDDPMREELAEIRDAGERAATLTQQLLAFSRKQIVEPRAIALNEVIGEFSRLVRRLIGDDIEVITELSPDLGPVMADRGQMHQVLMNLAVNARDAMTGGGQLLVATANADLAEGDPVLQDAKPGPYVVLTMSDTGAGMDAETVQRIFEPFFTTKPQGVGTGLGLATVYGIVNQSGGFIRVASEPGDGTTFRIYLPRIDREAQAAAPRTAAKPASGGTETILVVEDQEEVRRLAVSVLRKNGYQLLEAANGAEAIEIAAGFDGRIDLLLTDVVMPGINGRDLAARLREARRGLKVLFMSGYATEVIARPGAVEAGYDFLPKPFTGADLAAKVRETLGRRAARGRVVVIDDDDAVRRLLAQMLEESGYEVFPANDGVAGLRAVEGAGADLVITDLVMPEREGLETVRLLRQRFPTVRVIAISGAFGGDFLRVASAMGAQATFAKPIQPERLLAAVRSLIG